MDVFISEHVSSDDVDELVLDSLQFNVTNLFKDLPKKLELEEEHHKDIENNAAFRLRRIVSKGHCTPKGEWHDQPYNEWVIMLKGAARLEFENQEQLIAVYPGDYIHLDAHQKHRIDWTDPDCETVWLVLDYGRNL